MSDGDAILYSTEDGQAESQLRATGGTVWLSQMEIAKLFHTTKRNISLHARNILAVGELDPESTAKEDLTVQTKGERQVKRSVIAYRLEMILPVGYRVRSPRGVEFRRWVTAASTVYLVKDFVINDEHLKDPVWDCFDELLERVRDILALSKDYDAKSPTVTIFYATIQNKMLYAVTNHTAGELVRVRAISDRPNMGLTTWKNADKRRGLRKSDVGTAKNCFGEVEIMELKRIANAAKVKNKWRRDG